MPRSARVISGYISKRRPRFSVSLLLTCQRSRDVEAVLPLAAGHLLGLDVLLAQVGSPSTKAPSSFQTWGM